MGGRLFDRVEPRSVRKPRALRITKTAISVNLTTSKTGRVCQLVHPVQRLETCDLRGGCLPSDGDKMEMTSVLTAVRQVLVCVNLHDFIDFEQHSSTIRDESPSAR